MQHPERSVLLVTSILVLALAGPAAAGPLGCGQPSSGGDSPVTSDALVVLQTAVGRPTSCNLNPCVCDVNGSGTVTALDALTTLKRSVDDTVPLTCNCPRAVSDDASVEVSVLPGSAWSLGWTGVAHDKPFAAGFHFGLGVASLCSNDNSPCAHDADCTGGATCQRTCDYDTDKTCELTGPAGPTRCASTLAGCATNADCAGNAPCVAFFSPPQPVSAGGTPLCITAYFDDSIHGSADLASGDIVLDSMRMRWRVNLGISLPQPCPRCGHPGQQPAVGDTFTCEGGPATGNACRVDAVSELFGGVSYDCAPNLANNISGSGIEIRIAGMTSGTTTRTAALACSAIGLQSHPSRDNGKCIDDGSLCSSNADCRRCSADASLACATNGDCTGKGTCAVAPAQPVTCGYWCQCGFCDGDAALPCFGDNECPAGKACIAGTGTLGSAKTPQTKPNDCALDKFICGGSDEGQCATTLAGTCSLQPYRFCNTNADCPADSSGTCVATPRSCFGSQITLSGESSVFGSHCEGDGAACASNGDCAGDVCVGATTAPTSEGLFCMPASNSQAINASFGSTGPGSLHLKELLRWCRCGDGAIGCGEQCDDGNVVSGDGCDDHCRIE